MPHFLTGMATKSAVFLAKEMMSGSHAFFQKQAESSRIRIAMWPATNSQWSTQNGAVKRLMAMEKRVLGQKGRRLDSGDREVGSETETISSLDWKKQLEFGNIKMTKIWSEMCRP